MLYGIWKLRRRIESTSEILIISSKIPYFFILYFRASLLCLAWDEKGKHGHDHFHLPAQDLGIDISDGCCCWELRDATCSDVTFAATWYDVRVLPAELELRGTDGWIMMQERCVDPPRLPGVFLESARVSDTRPSRTELPTTQPGRNTTHTPSDDALGATNWRVATSGSPVWLPEGGPTPRTLSWRHLIRDKAPVERALLFNKYSHHISGISYSFASINYLIFQFKIRPESLFPTPIISFRQYLNLTWKITEFSTKINKVCNITFNI